MEDVRYQDTDFNQFALIGEPYRIRLANLMYEVHL